jgi:hypothetical protein
MSARDGLLNDQAATTCWNQCLRPCGFRVNPSQFEVVPGRLNNRQASVVCQDVQFAKHAKPCDLGISVDTFAPNYD